VEFTVEFSFRNRVFEALAGQFFDSALRKMTTAFVERADALYGAGGSNSSNA
jgi:coenzyme Q-binding protein COQ10